MKVNVFFFPLPEITPLLKHTVLKPTPAASPYTLQLCLWSANKCHLKPIYWGRKKVIKLLYRKSHWLTDSVQCCVRETHSVQVQELRIRCTFLSFRNLSIWLFMKYCIFTGVFYKEKLPRSLGVIYIFFHKIPQEESPATVILSNILMKSASFMCECGYKHSYAPWQSGSGEGPVWKRPPVAAFKGGWEERTWLRITQARSDSTCWFSIPPTIQRFISSPVLCRIHAAPKLVHYFTCVFFLFYYPP